MTPLLIIMCGLPGSGKSTVSRRLAQRVEGLRWDKDELRHLMFPPELVQHDRALNDLCMEMLYAAALRVFARQDAGASPIILDGRPFMERGQRERARAAAQQAKANIAFVLCTAPKEVLSNRILGDGHLAVDRDADLLGRLIEAADPFEGDEIVIDTAQMDVESAVAHCLQQLSSRGLI